MGYKSKVILMTLIMLCSNLTLSAQTIRLKLSNVTVKEAMEALTKEYDYSFVFESGDVNTRKVISINLQNRSIDEAIRQILRGQDVSYEINNKNIVISKKKQIAVTQSMEVRGIIIDEKGDPVIGASVVERGTTNGTLSDMEGKFSLNVSQKAVLTISYVGYNKQEVPANNRTVMEIVLKEDNTILDEVVVVGFGTQKKVNLTGSVTMVDSKAFEARPVTNATQALQGLVPGLNIIQSNGEIYNTPSVNIRGMTTIGDGSSGAPLILIDGMEGSLNTLNPQDIETVSVLKDAAASSIYGSRAPFGVILVTTKKGKTGKATVNYNNTFRFDTPVKMPHIADSYKFAMFMNDGHTNTGQTAWFDEEWIQRIMDYQNGLRTDQVIPDTSNPMEWGNSYRFGHANNDWYDILFGGHKLSQEHNISVQGGKDWLTYYVSGYLLDRNGMLNYGSDNLHKYGLTGKFSAKVSEYLTINYSTRYTHQDLSIPRYSGTYNFYWDMARQGWPVLPLHDPNGYLSYSWASRLENEGKTKQQTDEYYNQLQFVFEPVKNWKIIGEGNMKSQFYNQNQTTLPVYMYDVNGDSYLYGNTETNVSEQSNKDVFYNVNLYTDYGTEFGEGHFLKGLVGFQSELYKNHYLSAMRYGIMVDNLTTLNTTSGLSNGGEPVAPIVGGTDTEWATAGFFGRINYDYKGRYLLEVNLRYDGSSRYRADQRWIWLPSVSAGWNVAQESFWAPCRDWVSMLKIRGSYGVLGNQNTSSYYPTYQVMGMATGKGEWLLNGKNTNLARVPGLVSSKLSWEKVSTWNAGLDIAAFRNRLTLSVDYFRRYTNNMIGPAQELPSTLGIDVPKYNNTDMVTYGFETEIEWRDRIKDFNYSVRFLLSDSQTKILEYPNESYNLSTHYTGKKSGEIWGYTTVGIAKTQEEMDAHLAGMPNGGQDIMGSNWSAGDIMFKDVNGDGKVDGGAGTLDDHGDLTVIGNNRPRFNFGLDISMEWKGVDVRAFFQGIMKRDYFCDGYYFWGINGGTIWNSTALVEHIDYFRADPDHPLGLNLDSYYPRPLIGIAKNQRVQTAYLQNAAYIRLKNLQVGYTLPRNFTQKYKVEKLRIFLSGENLWTGTKMAKMFDPETVDGGQGGNVYPLTKTVAVGLSINF